MDLHAVSGGSNTDRVRLGCWWNECRLPKALVCNLQQFGKMAVLRRCSRAGWKCYNWHSFDWTENMLLSREWGQLPWAKTLESQQGTRWLFDALRKRLLVLFRSERATLFSHQCPSPAHSYPGFVVIPVRIFLFFWPTIVCGWDLTDCVWASPVQQPCPLISHVERQVERQAWGKTRVRLQCHSTPLRCGLPTRPLWDHTSHWAQGRCSFCIKPCVRVTWWPSYARLSP